MDRLRNGMPHRRRALQNPFDEIRRRFIARWRVSGRLMTSSIPSQKIVLSRSIGSSVFDVCWEPTGVFFGAALEDGRINILDPRIDLSSSGVVNVLKGHLDACNVLQFVGNELCPSVGLLSGSDDCSVLLWDLRHTRTPVKAMLDHRSWVKNIEMLPGPRQRCLTSGFDGMVRLWNLDDNEDACAETRVSGSGASEATPGSAVDDAAVSMAARVGRYRSHGVLDFQGEPIRMRLSWNTNRALCSNAKGTTRGIHLVVSSAESGLVTVVRNLDVDALSHDFEHEHEEFVSRQFFQQQVRGGDLGDTGSDDRASSSRRQAEANNTEYLFCPTAVRGQHLSVDIDPTFGRYLLMFSDGTEAASGANYLSVFDLARSFSWRSDSDYVERVRQAITAVCCRPLLGARNIEEQDNDAQATHEPFLANGHSDSLASDLSFYDSRSDTHDSVSDNLESGDESDRESRVLSGSELGLDVELQATRPFDWKNLVDQVSSNRMVALAKTDGCGIPGIISTPSFSYGGVLAVCPHLSGARVFAFDDRASYGTYISEQNEPNWAASLTLKRGDDAGAVFVTRFHPFEPVFACGSSSGRTDIVHAL